MADVAANVAAIREEIAAAARHAGRPPEEVELLAAVKYVEAGDLPELAAAGIGLVGENRAQELERKQADHRSAFEWDFIGQLQSRKVRALVDRVRLIHSVASDSAVRELHKHAPRGFEVLVEVNIAREDGKAGIAPDGLDAFLDRAAGGPFAVTGLMTMPPAATRPEDSRRWFAALRELAAARGLPRLSMGTTQDFAVAVEEGATIVRVGSRLWL